MAKGFFVHAVLPIVAATGLGVVIGVVGSWLVSKKSKYQPPQSPTPHRTAKDSLTCKACTQSLTLGESGHTPVDPSSTNLV